MTRSKKLLYHRRCILYINEDDVRTIKQNSLLIKQSIRWHITKVVIHGLEVESDEKSNIYY